ncbi:HNH endonuclease signature motif containing protein [Saccharothrix coeruleofusca]|uniref:HNH endonuclease n=1 Tax=Saccharothrix coeruleofusca TaxID=33919 RepID=A0A918AMQ0_9PSEU|nr:HNH endonuclease signature motif containing protein [Saccharothrix coeruleofusca]GGP58201.1 HNH endonuclease [Saccharothrix coeruleofusca]
MTSLPALLSDNEVLAAFSEVEAAMRSLHRRRLDLLAEVLRRGLDVESCRRAVRVDSAVMKRWITQVKWFLPGRSPTGQPLGSAHPAVSAALAELSEEHLVELSRAIRRRLPQGAEEALVRTAVSAEPKAVKELARRLRDRAASTVGQGDVLRLRNLADGRLELRGRLSVEAGAEFRAALEPLSRPRAGDTRPLAQRQGEAFGELLGLALRSAELPSEAGERPHVNITLDYAALRRGVGRAALDGGRQLSAAQVRRIACDAKVVPVVLGGRSEVLDVGRAKRVLTLAQRRALHVRDGGCAFPGCDRPPKWCEVHHVVHWVDGGQTDVANLVLLCKKHHALAHGSQWRIVMDGGVPFFVPPRQEGPRRHPRRAPGRRTPVIGARHARRPPPRRMGAAGSALPHRGAQRSRVQLSM